MRPAVHVSIHVSIVADSTGNRRMNSIRYPGRIYGARDRQRAPGQLPLKKLITREMGIVSGRIPAIPIPVYAPLAEEDGLSDVISDS